MIRKVGKMWERRTQLERKPQIAAIKATSWKKRNQCPNKTADQFIHLNSKNEDGLEDVAERIHCSKDQAGEVGHQQGAAPELQSQDGQGVCDSFGT